MINIKIIQPMIQALSILVRFSISVRFKLMLISRERGLRFLRAMVNFWMKPVVKEGLIFPNDRLQSPKSLKFPPKARELQGFC